MTLQTKKSMISDLEQLGVKKGMTLIVHSSLKSLGDVVGGPVSVILALEEAVGVEGNLVMPTQTEHLCEPTENNDNLSEDEIRIIKDNLPIYYPDLTPTSYMGIIPELFRKQNGVLRSSHPHVSFSAWGKDAKRIIGNHDLNYALNKDSPLGKIYDLEGYILFIGAPTNSNTSLHLAEYSQKNTYIQPKVWGVKLLIEGREQWSTYNDINNESDDFGQIFNEFNSATGLVKKGSIGEAESFLMPQKNIVDFSVDWMNKNRK
ncbi:aminoglycoside N(3)-acetyltransferase [Aureibacillus halotolerans]|uniref:Aminoglycoside N(3)-acetyltransferase n=1 Tax=Aureibacillus halotolerans TaxID=1508390 RepID=A0A4V3D5S0_9BACI|nr:AAC(3) family N-acetyltransferase [Aureibacillus halotolerans]TDQ41087.1 aminoglycoside 3-N-acetyltransferase [Aureibacillus halotolerans]